MALAPRTIALIGVMGSGKSNVGRRLAQLLGVAFRDADHAIEAAAERTIAEIFATDGEAYFRDLEHTTIEYLLRTGDGVLALGGGAAMHEVTQRALRRHAFVVHLRVSLHEALDRVGEDPARPMLRRPDLALVHEARTSAYDDLADVVVDTDGRDQEQVCREVAAAVRRLPVPGSAPEV